MAALAGEALPLIRRLRGVRWHGPRLAVGRLGGAPVGILRCGVGREAARARTGSALARCPAERVVSVGTCGALADDIPVGALVEARALLDPPRALHSFGLGVRAVVLATVPRVVGRPADRAAWAARGAEVCEMEAAGVIEAAGGTPALALKVVSDLAGARVSRAAGLPGVARRLLFEVHAVALVERSLAPAVVRWIGTLG